MCQGHSSVALCRTPLSPHHDVNDVGKSEMALTDAGRRQRRELPRWVLAFSIVVASLVAMSSIFKNEEVLSQTRMTITVRETSHVLPLPQAITRLSQTTSQHEMTEGGVHVVISHCSVPLDWIFEEYLVDVPCKSITVYTKCGRPLFSDPTVDLSSQSLIRVEQMPNVGRCDHSYAWWIREMLTTTLRHGEDVDSQQHGRYHPNDQVLFMKDNDNMKRHNEGNEQHRSLELMRHVSAKRGFDCGSRYHAVGFSGVGTNYADKLVLGRFRLRRYKTKSKTHARDPFEAPVRPLSAWTETIPVNVTFTTDGIVEVCLGGVFMASIQQIVNAPVTDWDAIVTALSRGDNIEEGHYMERLWAVLFAPQVSPEKEKQLLEAKTGIKPRNGFLGFIFVRKGSPILDED